MQQARWIIRPLDQQEATHSNTFGFLIALGIEGANVIFPPGWEKDVFNVCIKNQTDEGNNPPFRTLQEFKVYITGRIRTTFTNNSLLTFLEKCDGQNLHLPGSVQEKILGFSPELEKEVIYKIMQCIVYLTKQIFGGKEVNVTIPIPPAQAAAVAQQIERLRKKEEAERAAREERAAAQAAAQAAAEAVRTAAQAVRAAEALRAAPPKAAPPPKATSPPKAAEPTVAQIAWRTAKSAGMSIEACDVAGSAANNAITAGAIKEQALAAGAAAATARRNGATKEQALAAGAEELRRIRASSGSTLRKGGRTRTLYKSKKIKIRKSRKNKTRKNKNNSKKNRRRA